MPATRESVCEERVRQIEAFYSDAFRSKESEVPYLDGLLAGVRRLLEEGRSNFKIRIPRQQPAPDGLLWHTSVGLLKTHDDHVWNLRFLANLTDAYIPPKIEAMVATIHAKPRHPDAEYAYRWEDDDPAPVAQLAFRLRLTEHVSCIEAGVTAAAPVKP